MNERPHIERVLIGGDGDFMGERRSFGSPCFHERQLVLFSNGWVDLHGVILVVDSASFSIYSLVISLDDRMATCRQHGHIITPPIIAKEKKTEWSLPGRGFCSRTTRVWEIKFDQIYHKFITFDDVNVCNI